MDDILKEFLVESYENLDRLDRDLVALEKEPRDRDTLASIFRTIHTLKGGSGFLGLGKLESIAHVAENLLSKLRDEIFPIDPEITSILLATLDAVREILTAVESSGEQGDTDYACLVELIRAVTDDKSKAQAPAGRVALPPPSCPLEISVPPGPSLPAPTLVPTPAESSVAIPARPEAGVHRPSEDPATPAPEPADSRGSMVSDRTIRVDVGLLDKLMNLVGELVLARNQILQFTSQRADTAFLATAQRLNLITTELQGSVMKTRMQPIGNVWNKLPRVVRDLATSCQKQVRLEMEGQDTELDKTIIEAIKDPLTHIVRNSVDHGIEPAAVRIAQHKPAEGCLTMRAFHEGGQVNIEICDDGGGINYERIRQKALDRGLISPEQAARLNENEALNLIFLPGFSTAEKITNVSGRGVGLDVVKTNIEKIGGTVDLLSHPGEGTTIKIKIPLTLAIIPALIVGSGGERFAIPQVSLLELVRLEGGAGTGPQIEIIAGAPVYRLRGQLLPLASLNRELRLPDSADSGPVNIVVLQADGHPFGLIVDEINDTEEIVVKPLGKQLKGVASFAGATIMGDGRVALILDVLGLAQGAGVVAKARERSVVEKAGARKPAEAGETLLVCEASPGSRLAIPLSLVARLEEISQSAIEYSGGQEVVRYRGQILPLIRVARHLPAPGSASLVTEPMQVVVYAQDGRSVGLVVGRIHDIVQEAITIERRGAPGILGSVVIQEKVTDLLDVRALIQAADPGFFAPGPQAVAA